MPVTMAARVSRADLLAPSLRIARCLWLSTVEADSRKMAATSKTEQPSDSRRTTYCSCSVRIGPRRRGFAATARRSPLRAAIFCISTFAWNGTPTRGKDPMHLADLGSASLVKSCQSTGCGVPRPAELPRGLINGGNRA
jgi:hypothetical protein